MSIKQLTMKGLFERCGLEASSVEEGVYDVSSYNILARTFNSHTNTEEPKQIQFLVKKPVSSIWGVFDSKGTLRFRGSAHHKVFDADRGDYVSLCDVECFTGLTNSFTLEEFYTKDLGIKEHVYDFHVEGNENYFSGGILSHNTTPGGHALRFFASVRIATREGEWIMKGDTKIGMRTICKTLKNKVSAPYKTCELILLYGKGYQMDEEYVYAFDKFGILDRGGAGWITLFRDGKSFKIQGVANVVKYFQENPAYFTSLKLKLRKVIETGILEEDVPAEEPQPEATEALIEAESAEQEDLEKEFLAEGEIIKVEEEFPEEE